MIALACVNLTRAFAVNLTDNTTDVSNATDSSNELIESGETSNASNGSESLNTAGSDSDDSLNNSMDPASQGATELPSEGLKSTDELPEIKQEAINRGQKLITVIDTGSAGQYAEAQVNFTDEIDVDEMGHGSFMSKIIKDNADNKAYILSLKAFTKDGKGTVADVMKALQFAIDLH